jgi:hypothetical protein
MSKRATSKTDPLDGPIDFDRFGPVRRNAFAGAGEPGGPSLAALWEMPQLAGDAVMLRRGRPGRGTSRPTIARSVRLPAAVWTEIEAKARARHLNVHQVMRAALLGWLAAPTTSVARERPTPLPPGSASRHRRPRNRG